MTKAEMLNTYMTDSSWAGERNGAKQCRRICDVRQGIDGPPMVFWSYCDNPHDSYRMSIKSFHQWVCKWKAREL